MKRLIGCLVCLGLLLLVAGSWGSGPERDSTGKNRNYEVRMLGGPNRFDAKDLEIQIGDSVTWINDTGVEHSATADDDSEVKFTEVDLMKKTFSSRVKFEKAGKVKYHCKFHPSMTGTLTVK